MKLFTQDKPFSKNRHRLTMTTASRRTSPLSIESRLLDHEYRPMKIETSMTALFEAGSDGLITLEALNIYGETCLNTSVSIMRHQFRLVISSTPEPFITRIGSKVRFTRYRLEEKASRKRALALINDWRQKRKAEPLFEGY